MSEDEVPKGNPQDKTRGSQYYKMPLKKEITVSTKLREIWDKDK